MADISKTIYTHLTSFNKLLCDWIKMTDKGTKVCKAVSALKLHECTDDYYPSALYSLMDCLLATTKSLQDIIDGVFILNNQLKAVAKLKSDSSPVINTWSTKQISDCVSRTYDSLKQEMKLKTIITENLAHSRDEHLIEILVSSWELEVFFDPESTAYLFADVGLNSVT